ncbi:MAG: hypothetical protein PHP01_02720 [Phycisphaerae bacterium]|nr:hypothetical protein [Phycisphaerae bacterium]
MKRLLAMLGSPLTIAVVCDGVCGTDSIYANRNGSDYLPILINRYLN